MTENQIFHPWEGVKVGCSVTFSTVTAKIRKPIGPYCTTQLVILRD